MDEFYKKSWIKPFLMFLIVSFIFLFNINAQYPNGSYYFIKDGVYVECTFTDTNIYFFTNKAGVTSTKYSFNSDSITFFYEESSITHPFKLLNNNTLKIGSNKNCITYHQLDVDLPIQDLLNWRNIELTNDFNEAFNEREDSILKLRPPPLSVE